jgi:hypothetical protein
MSRWTRRTTSSELGLIDSGLKVAEYMAGGVIGKETAILVGVEVFADC